MSWKLSDASSPSRPRKNWSIPNHLRRNPENERLGRPLVVSSIDPDALIRYVDSSISREEYALSNNLVSAEFLSSVDALTSSDHAHRHSNDDKTSWVSNSCHQARPIGDIQSLSHQLDIPVACQTEVIRQENVIEKGTVNIGDIKQESNMLIYSVKIEETRENGLLNNSVSTHGKKENHILEDGVETDKKLNGINFDEKPEIGGNIKEKQQNGLKFGLLKDGVDSEQNVRRADEAYRAACSALSEGDAESALSLLQIALLKCPSDRHNALGKVQRLIVTAMQLLEKKSINLTTLSHDKDDS